MLVESGEWTTGDGAVRLWLRIGRRVQGEGVVGVTGRGRERGAGVAVARRVW